MIRAPLPKPRVPGRFMRPETPERGQEVETPAGVAWVQGYTDDAAGVWVSSPTIPLMRIELLDFYSYGPDGLTLGPLWDRDVSRWTPRAPAHRGSTDDGQ